MSTTAFPRLAGDSASTPTWTLNPQAEDAASHSSVPTAAQDGVSNNPLEGLGDKVQAKIPDGSNERAWQG